MARRRHSPTPIGRTSGASVGLQGMDLMGASNLIPQSHSAAQWLKQPSDRQSPGPERASTCCELHLAQYLIEGLTVAASPSDPAEAVWQEHAHSKTGEHPPSDGDAWQQAGLQFARRLRLLDLGSTRVSMLGKYRHRLSSAKPAEHQLGLPLFPDCETGGDGAQQHDP
eukprot:12428590-Karenia_brevis.AAC.1